MPRVSGCRRTALRHALLLLHEVRAAAVVQAAVAGVEQALLEAQAAQAVQRRARAHAVRAVDVQRGLAGRAVGSTCLRIK